jgi:hypothetical protein
VRVNIHNDVVARSGAVSELNGADQAGFMPHPRLCGRSTSWDKKAELRIVSPTRCSPNTVPRNAKRLDSSVSSYLFSTRSMPPRSIARHRQPRAQVNVLQYVRSSYRVQVCSDSPIAPLTLTHLFPDKHRLQLRHHTSTLSPYFNLCVHASTL